MITCPSCGPRPVEEFTYAHDISQYFGLIEHDGKLVTSDDPEDGDIHRWRIFHGPEADCGEYVTGTINVDGEDLDFTD